MIHDLIWVINEHPFMTFFIVYIICRTVVNTFGNGEDIL